MNSSGHLAPAVWYSAIGVVKRYQVRCARGFVWHSSPDCSSITLRLPRGDSGFCQVSLSFFLRLVPKRILQEDEHFLFLTLVASPPQPHLPVFLQHFLASLQLCPVDCVPFLRIPQKSPFKMPRIPFYGLRKLPELSAFNRSSGHFLLIPKSF